MERRLLHVGRGTAERREGALEHLLHVVDVGTVDPEELELHGGGETAGDALPLLV
jgi:hypothetical protein